MMPAGAANDCDLCGGGKLELLLEKNRSHYTRCLDCGFIASALDVEASGLENETYFERAIETYVKKAYSIRKQREYAEKLSMFRPYRRQGRILEIGANVGGFIHQAREQGWEAIGVEPVEACAAWGRSERGLDLRPQTLEEAGFDDDFFDGVYSHNVFEHLASPTPVFREAARVLRPQGLAYISTVNYDSYTRRFLERDWKLIDPRHHFCLYTPETLRRYCEKVGLSVIGIRSHGVRLRANHLPPLQGWRRWAEELKKLPLSAASRMTLKGDNIAVLAIKVAKNPRGRS